MPRAGAGSLADGGLGGAKPTGAVGLAPPKGVPEADGDAQCHDTALRALGARRPPATHATSQRPSRCGGRAVSFPTTEPVGEAAQSTAGTVLTGTD